MGGLALGSFIFGRFADRLKFPILTYAAIEAGRRRPRAGHPPSSSAASTPRSRTGSPTTAATASTSSPSCASSSSRSCSCRPPPSWAPPSHSSRATSCNQGGAVGQRVGALYAVNTFGAVAGTFLAGFFLLPRRGPLGHQRPRGCTNLALAGLIVLFRKQLLGDGVAHLLARAPPAAARPLDPTSPPEASADTPADDEAPDAPPRATDEDDFLEEPMTRAARIAVLLAAGGSGFAALAYEVILTRALDMVIGSSIYSFTIILMGFLIGIGGGSAMASWILRVRPSPMATRRRGGHHRGPRAASSSSSTRPTSRGSSGSSPRSSCCSARPSRPRGASPCWRWRDAARHRAPGPSSRTSSKTASRGCSSTWRCPRRPTATRPRDRALLEHVGTIQWLSFVVALLCALPAAVGMGAAFPLGVRAYATGPRRVGGHQPVYTVNTVGSILGSLLTGFVIMPGWAWRRRCTSRWRSTSRWPSRSSSRRRRGAREVPPRARSAPCSSRSPRAWAPPSGARAALARSRGAAALLPPPVGPGRDDHRRLPALLADGMIQPPRRPLHRRAAPATARSTSAPKTPSTTATASPPR
jgi:hypothetical protein